MKYFILFLLVFPFVDASGIGVSPTKIQLNDESYIHILNPNNYSVNYSISNIPSWIEIKSEGEIEANSKKTLLIKKLKNKEGNISAQISFSNRNFISTAVQFQIITKKEKTIINYLPYLVGIILISGLIILFR